MRAYICTNILIWVFFIYLYGYLIYTHILIDEPILIYIFNLHVVYIYTYILIRMSILL
jgi:hypothetical protein